MSTASTPDLDFWEFVNCARCHLPFETEGGAPPVPFWLTECGHVVCNNHLSELRARHVLHAQLILCSITDSDQSCAQCGAQGIQLVPLQKEVCVPRVHAHFYQCWTRPWHIAGVPHVRMVLLCSAGSRLCGLRNEGMSREPVISLASVISWVEYVV